MMGSSIILVFCLVVLTRMDGRWSCKADGSWWCTEETIRNEREMAAEMTQSQSGLHAKFCL